MNWLIGAVVIVIILGTILIMGLCKALGKEEPPKPWEQEERGEDS